jgi:hypothetical protein
MMNWSERYAMAQGDTIETLRVKLQKNADKYTDARSAPHTWLKNYNDAVNNDSDHASLSNICHTNADQARVMGETNHQRYFANSRMWRELAGKHGAFALSQNINERYK